KHPPRPSCAANARFRAFPLVLEPLENRLVPGNALLSVVVSADVLGKLSANTDTPLRFAGSSLSVDFVATERSVRRPLGSYQPPSDDGTSVSHVGRDGGEMPPPFTPELPAPARSPGIRSTQAFFGKPSEIAGSLSALAAPTAVNRFFGVAARLPGNPESAQ